MSTFENIKDLQNFLIGSSTAVATSLADHANKDNLEHPYYPFGRQLLESTFPPLASLFVHYAPQPWMTIRLIDDSGDEDRKKEHSQIPDWATALVEAKINPMFPPDLGWEKLALESKYLLEKPISWLQILEQKARFIPTPKGGDLTDLKGVTRHGSNFSGNFDKVHGQLLEQVQHCFSQYGDAGQDALVGFVAIGTVWAWALFFKEFTPPAPTHVDKTFNPKEYGKQKKQMNVAPDVKEFIELHKKSKQRRPKASQFYHPHWSPFVCEGTQDAEDEKERVKQCMEEVFPQELARLHERVHSAAKVLKDELSKFIQDSVASESN